MSQVNGNQNYFNMVVSSYSKREVLRTRMDINMKKALDPILKRWGYRDISKVTPQLRYYEMNLKPETQAGDTAGMEVFIKAPDSNDKLLKGFHPFINKLCLKSFTQPYMNENGWYLIRESSTGDGQLSLAVTFCHQLRHFKINFFPQEGTYKIASKSFENLHQLISYYADNSMKKTSEGPVYLLHPILGKVEDEPHEPAPTRPSPVSVPKGPQPEGGNGGVNRPLPALPSDPKPRMPPNNIPPTEPKPKQNGTDFTSRPLPPLPPPPTDESPPAPAPMPKTNSKPMKVLNITPNQLGPSYTDKPRKNILVPYLSLSPRVSPLTNNHDDSPPPPLPRTEPKHPSNFTPSPTLNPTNANPVSNGKSCGVSKNNSFKIQHSKLPENPPVPTPAECNLPHPWTEVYSNSQKKYYYYNSETCVTSWKQPLPAKESFSNSKQDITAEKKPTNSVSSTELSGPPPVRQRSQSSVFVRRHEKKPGSPDNLDHFTAEEVPELSHSDSQKIFFQRAAPSPPKHPESPPKVKSKQILANKLHRNESNISFDKTQPKESNNSYDKTQPKESNNSYDKTQPKESNNSYDKTQPKESNNCFDKTQPKESNNSFDKTQPKESNNSYYKTQRNESNNSFNKTQPKESNNSYYKTQPKESNNCFDKTQPKESNNSFDKTQPKESNNSYYKTQRNESNNSFNKTQPKESNNSYDKTQPKESNNSFDKTQPKESNNCFDKTQPKESNNSFDKTQPKESNNSYYKTQPKESNNSFDKPQPKESNNPYDILPAHYNLPPFNQFSAQLKPIKASKHQDSPPLSEKLSNPTNSSPHPKPSLTPTNSTPTGKPVKSGKYIIPAPPPNMPPAFSVENTPSTPRCNSSSKSKCMTLPHKNMNSSRNDLLDSIQGFNPHQLRSVTPDRPPSSSVSRDGGGNMLEVLRRRLEQRHQVIQDSDSSYEDADADW